MQKLKPPGKYTVTIPKFAGIITVVIACFAIIGWILNISFLKSLPPASPDMKFTTAICFAMAGINLYILGSASPVKKNVVIAGSICTWIILVIGTWTIFQYFFNRSYFLETFFPIQKPHETTRSILECMGMVESFNFILLAIVFLVYGKIKYKWIIQILLIAIIPGAGFVILNHLFSGSFLNSISLSVPIAMQTGILFITLTSAIFFTKKLDFPKFSFVNKMAIFLALIFLFRSMIFFAINKNNKDAAEVSKIEERLHKVAIMGDDLNLKLRQMQDIAQKYIISGGEYDSSYFITINVAAKKIIDSLAELTQHNTGKNLYIDSLRGRLNSYSALQTNLVKLRRDRGLDAVQKLVVNGQDNIMLGQLSVLISTIEQQENKSLYNLKSKNLRGIRNSSKLLTFFQVIAFFLFLVALIMIYYNSKYRNKVEEALQNSLKDISDYKYALDESSILTITDQNGIIKQVNNNFCAITKYEREELIGKEHRLLNSNHHSKEFIRDLWITINNGEVWRGEMKNKAKDGSNFWLDTTIVPFMNKRGKPYQYVAIRSDITKRKELEEEIKQFNLDLQKKVAEKSKEVIEKDQQYRFLLQNMKEGIQVIGFDWKYIFVNNAALEQNNNASEQQLTGRAIKEIYPNIENTKLFQVLHSCMMERRPEVMDHELEFSDGRKRFLEVRIQPVPEGLFILSMDISDRKKTEEKLRESLERYELVNKATQDTIWEWDAHTNRITLNNSFTGLYGYTKASIKNNHNLLFKNIHPADVQKIRANIKNCIKTARTYWYDEFRFRAADGAYRYVHLKAFVQYSEKGLPERMVGAMTDFTEKRKLEKELAEQKAQQQRLVIDVAIQSQEKEKNDLGKELHDNINQILSTVKLYLSMLSKGESRPEDNLIEKSSDYVMLAIAELRKLSHSLVAPSLGDISLEEALMHLASDANLFNKFQVNLSIAENYKKLAPDKDMELMFYRIIQEQLNNIIKYANASIIEVSIDINTADIILRVADNGIGFDVSKKTEGIGLKNINNRVSFYNGIMSIISPDTGGCCLEVLIPLGACNQIKKSYALPELMAEKNN